MAKTWQPKDPREKFAVTFDFSAELAEITTATVAVELLDGDDSDPAALLLGTAQIAGLTVRQRVHDGADQCRYLLTATASDGAETYVLAAILPVKTAR